MTRLLGVWPDRSPEWHSARAGRIGGSDIGVIAGWSTFDTRDDLLTIKRGEREPRPGSKATERGTWLESAVADWLADRFDLTYDDNRSQGTYVHADADWQMYNPDRVTTGGDLVEIKTAAAKEPEYGWGRAGTSEIPLTYQAQCMWGLHVLGLKVCRVGVLFGAPFQFSHYIVRHDPTVVAYLIHEGEQFMRDLTALPTSKEAA